MAAQQRQLESAAASARGRGSLRVACIQWPSPLMACGAWVPELIEVGACGAVVLRAWRGLVALLPMRSGPAPAVGWLKNAAACS